MFEYMTLCADPTLFDLTSAVRPSPVPSGVPMGIVTLPDFVVDVAIDGIRNAPAAKRGQIEPLDVGGRAGRLARVLQEFGGQRNGWYDVKYVAKSGGVGSVVLQRQLVKPQKKSPDFDPLSLRYIIPSKEDHDWLHIYGETTETVESSYAGLEVTVADIEGSPYSLTDLFVDARYIVIASKHITHAISAVSVVTQGLQRLSRLLPKKLSEDPDWRIPIGILIDLSALAKPDEAVRLVESFADLKSQASAFSVESTALCDRAPNFDTGHFQHVLVREATTLRLGSYVESLPNSIGHPMTREALTAGYVLVSACNLGWKLLRHWYHYFPRMRPIDRAPHDSFPHADQRQSAPSQIDSGLLPSLADETGDPIDLGDRIRFAALLAQLTKSTPMSYRELIKAVITSSEPAHSEVENEEVESVIAPSNGIEGNGAELEQKAAFLEHLVPRFEGPDSEQTLSLYLPTSEMRVFVSSCLLRDFRRKAETPKRQINKAVMFDLDATLLDSAGLLRACWFNGLRTLFKEIGLQIDSRGIQTIIDIYKAFVYEKQDGFRSLLRDHPDIPPEWQPCDFRQVWNHPYAWAALLWILNLKADSSLNHKWEDDKWRLILDSHTAKDGCKCIVCQQLGLLLAESKAEVGERRKLTLPLRGLLNRFRREIQEARAIFWKVDYPCYPQARSCVEMLRATPGCEVYVVTEGHEETQINKLKCTGLSDLFPRERVLSTGAASDAGDARSDLDKLLRSNERTRDVVASLVGKQVSADLTAHLWKLEAAIGSIKFLKNCLYALGKKAHKRFYSAVIDAIRVKPESPAQVLQSFLAKQDHRVADQLGQGRSMKFFMVGDRYDNDCKPLLEIFPSKDKATVAVGTCRILSGKRAWKYCPPEQGQEPTQYVCDTLAQVGHIMHNTESWKGIDLLEDVTPPALLELKNGVILYGPKEEDGDQKDQLEELANRFKDLSWAREDEGLRKERAVQDMLDQIEWDLAVCDVASLSRLLYSVKKNIEEWWQEVDLPSTISSQEPATSLIKGALQILKGVNWWRRRLQRPLLEQANKPEETLEWMLSARLLTYIPDPRLTTSLGNIFWVLPKPPAEIKPYELIQAIQYSHSAIPIMTALHRDHPEFEFQEVQNWLDNARRLQ